MPEASKRLGRPDRKEMPFLDHLEELRGVLLHSALAVVLLATAAWFVSARALDLLIDPVGTLVFLGPAEAFTLRMKVALLLGFLAALPYVLYRVWGFVAPGLFRNERTIAVLVVAGSTLLFAAGAAFGLLVMVPIAVRFLLAFGTQNLRPMIAAGQYFSFVTKFVIAFGIVAQLPLVVSLLTYAGLLEPAWLFRQWRYALVLIAVVAAIATPTPDVASQLLLGVPVAGLYFLSALLSFVIRARRRKRESAGEGEGEGRDGEEPGEEDPDEDAAGETRGTERGERTDGAGEEGRAPREEEGTA
jgi:sec-independent protein translocase protein TatC